jgi:hypothetical protein
MMKKIEGFTAAAIAACTLVGCSQVSERDTRPIPSVAAPPYICDYIPLHAVERMTGLHAPLAKGAFDLTSDDGYRGGSCGVYQPSGDQQKALNIVLATNNDPNRVESEVRNGAKRLPQILPDADGYYSSTSFGGHTGAVAVLIRGNLMLVVDMDRGAEGRDHEADVVALMKLIAPKLIADPPGTASPTTQKGT